jgi:hypothetical protein
VIRRVNPLHSPLVKDMVQTRHGNTLAILVRVPRAARMRGGPADVALMDGSPGVLRRRNGLQANTALETFAAGDDLFPPDVGRGGDPVLPFLVPLRPDLDSLYQAQADVLVQLVYRVVDRRRADASKHRGGDYHRPILRHVGRDGAPGSIQHLVRPCTRHQTGNETN